MTENENDRSEIVSTANRLCHPDIAVKLIIDFQVVKVGSFSECYVVEANTRQANFVLRKKPYFKCIQYVTGI